MHVFHGNNELAGYCSVLHALTLIGSTGHYGRRLTAAVIGFGNTARGAITALHALGVHDVTALTMRDVTAVASPIPSVVLGQLDRPRTIPSRTIVLKRTGPVPTAEFLAEHDIVVNCVLQDTDRPLMFVSDTSSPLPPGQPARRRVLRRRHGLRVRAPHDVRGADVHGRRRRPLLRRRPQPVLSVGLRHLGHQRGAHPLPADGHVGSFGVARV